jgi:hypothetical protein
MNSQVLSTISDLKDEIENYKNKYRREGLPEFGEINRYALYPVEQNNEKEYGWPEKFYDCDSPGIYAFLDENDKVLYIGKASMNNLLGYRLGSYFCYGESDRCKPNHQWIRNPFYIITMAVHDDMKFEAAALEEYLISRLRTLENKVGVRK